MANHYAMDPLTVPVQDGCDLLGIKRSTMYKLIADRKVDVVKFGRRTTITVDSLRRCATPKKEEAGKIVRRSDTADQEPA